MINRWRSQPPTTVHWLSIKSDKQVALPNRNQPKHCTLFIWKIKSDKKGGAAKWKLAQPLHAYYLLKKDNSWWTDGTAKWKQTNHSTLFIWKIKSGTQVAQPNWNQPNHSTLIIWKIKSEKQVALPKGNKPSRSMHIIWKKIVDEQMALPNSN